MAVTWQYAVDEARRCGFSHAVLLPARNYAEYVPNHEAARQGIHGDIRSSMSGARSVLIGVTPFRWFSQWPEGYAEVSAYYFHSQRGYAQIGALAERLRSDGAQVKSTQEHPLKLVGHEAGLGRIGKNSLLRNAIWGSCFAMHMLVTDIPPQETIVPLEAPNCGQCNKCLEACPTAALDGMGHVDTSRCIRTYMLRGEVIPVNLRGKMDNRLLGCEICQRVCPHNNQVASNAPPFEAFSIEKLLAGDVNSIGIIRNQIGRNEGRAQRLQAQACITAGNSLRREYLPLLHALARHENPVISTHALWAAEKIESGGSL